MTAYSKYLTATAIVATAFSSNALTPEDFCDPKISCPGGNNGDEALGRRSELCGHFFRQVIN